jgi:hypothetical protein
MKPKSGKGKSRRLQNFVAGVFLNLGFGQLRVDDVFPRQMGGAGVDTVMSPKAQSLFPYNVECKQVEKLNIHAVYAEHAEKYVGSTLFPIVVHSKNRAQVLVTLSFEDFISLVHGKQFLLIDGLSQIAIRDICSSVAENRDSWKLIEAAFRGRTVNVKQEGV